MTQDTSASGGDTKTPVFGFGEDAEFTLDNPAWKLLLLATITGIIGCAPYLIDDKGSSRGALMRFVIGPLLLVFTAWLGSKGLKIVGAKPGRALVTSRSFELARPGEAPREVPLESIERVLHATQNGRRTHTTFEMSDGTSAVLSSNTLSSVNEGLVGALVSRRSELRRAGVRGREELGAAEAYLALSSSGARPFAVAVKKNGKTKLDIFPLTTPDDPAPRGAHIFIPSRVFKVLEEQASLPNDARPLRGVG